MTLPETSISLGHLARSVPLGERRAERPSEFDRRPWSGAIEASAALAPGLRPNELHLCAPACLEEEVADKLHALARERAHFYYTELDKVLDISFRAMSQGHAIGACGLERDYEGLEGHDVSGAFDFWVHTEYKNRFADFIAPVDEAPARKPQSKG